MQLNDAKKYLIIILVILNICLLYGIAKENIKYEKKFTKKNIKSLETILEKNNISIDFKLSTKTEMLSPISVNYARLEDDEYKKLRENYQNIQVINDFYIELYENHKITDIDELSSFAKEFIKNNFDKNKYSLKEQIHDGSNIMLVYEQTQSSIFLDTSYIKFIYNDIGGINISILKIKDIRNIDTKLKIISNAQAVTRMIPQLQKNDEILSIDLVYSILDEDEERQMTSVTMLPFYRAKMNDNRYIYVKATE